MPTAKPAKGKRKTSELSVRQHTFAVAYAATGNGTRSAIVAGYSEAGAAQQAHLLLRNPKVQALIKRENADRWKRIQMDGDEVLGRLATLARVDVRRVFDEKGALVNPADLDESTAFCVASVEAQLAFGDDGAPPEEIRKIKLRDPMPALRTLAQALKIIGPEVNVQVSVDLAGKLAAARKRVRERAQA
jgi:phage terminase small subunit